MAENSSSTVASWPGFPHVEVQVVCEAKHVLNKIFLFPAIWEPPNAHPDNGPDKLLYSCLYHLRGTAMPWLTLARAFLCFVSPAASCTSPARNFGPPARGRAC